MDALLTPLMQSPRLPDYVRKLSDYLKAEQEKRKVFYQNIRDDEKAEFINGEVICHSPARQKHILAVENLGNLIAAFIKQHKIGLMIREKALVRLTRNDFEPDICFFRKEVADTFTGETMFYPVPDFVVEVLSESTEKRDRGIKMEDYAVNGVKEYWLVNSDAKEVEQYILEGSLFRLKEKVGHGTVCCVVLSGLEIPVKSIFEPEHKEEK